jgi:hypothetical protein
MSEEQLDNFLADLRTINPKINIDRRIGRKTSALGLITHLRNTVSKPKPIPGVFEARRYCSNPHDARLNKYVPAFRRLIAVWGHGNDHYPNADVRIAQFNYEQLSGNAPKDVDPLPFEELQAYENNAYAFRGTKDCTYLKALTLDDGERLDITARSLLLSAGLYPPAEGHSDNGYVSKLKFTSDDLKRMEGHSILDVACGAAMFRAEMEALFGCQTTGLDLNAAHIDAEAITAGKQRYTNSMLYLKYLSDVGKFHEGTVSPEWDWLIDRAVWKLPKILRLYAKNPPQTGDVFSLAEDGNRWDYVTSTYLLCYFNEERQTEAIRNMCSAARRAVFVTSGGGRTQFPKLIYDQAEIRSEFPKCRIEIKSAETHHILLR